MLEHWLAWMVLGCKSCLFQDTLKGAKCLHTVHLQEYHPVS